MKAVYGKIDKSNMEEATEITDWLGKRKTVISSDVSTRDLNLSENSLTLNEKKNYIMLMGPCNFDPFTPHFTK